MWIPLRIDFDLGRESDVSPTDKVGHGDMLYQGADFDFELAISIDGAPVDYSGCTFEIRIWERSKKEPFYTDVGITGTTGGVIKGSISASCSDSWMLASTRNIGTMPLSDCSYEMSCNRLDGRIERLAEGVLVVSLRG